MGKQQLTCFQQFESNIGIVKIWVVEQILTGDRLNYSGQTQ